MSIRYVEIPLFKSGSDLSSSELDSLVFYNINSFYDTEEEAYDYLNFIVDEKIPFKFKGKLIKHEGYLNRGARNVFGKGPRNSSGLLKLKNNLLISKLKKLK